MYSRVGYIQPPCHLLPQERACKWEKSATETYYFCNQAAGFQCCVTKLQQDIQMNIKTLEQAKGKSSKTAKKVLNEIRDLMAFSQTMSFVWIKLYNT